MENSNNQHQAQTAWDFFRSFDPNGPRRPGVGVDHNGPEFPSGFPFDHSQWGGPWGGSGPWENWSGPWARPWGRSGWHGRHGHGHGHGYGHGHGSGPSRHDDRRESDNEENDDQDMESSPETLRHTPDESAASEHGGDFPPPPPPPGAPNHPRHPHHRGPPHGFGPRSRRGGRCERSGRGGRGGRHPPPPPYEGPFDFRPLIHAFSTHPFAQAFRDYVGQNRAGPSGEQNEQQDGSFVPPVDIFNTEKAFVLHVSLPGANKEDIGVNWDGEKVNIAGVIYRPGNEEFLQTLTSSERRIGMFERSIKLPPAGSDEKDDVDGLSITAKMENGILIVTVPKTEKEWTQIHKIDVE
ncbi:HSP20-like chaperone [Biscogniauxia mediterranea]|nr:HSP20-like chaperone [Biscogniauxia mediterranea]